MPDNFDKRLAAAAARLEQEAAVRSPAGVRARGDQRRKRHTTTMAVVPVAVLAIAGTVGLTLRPSGAGGSVSGVRTSVGSTTPSASASTSTSTSPGAATAPTGTVDLAHDTLTVLDARGNLVKTLKITAGAPASPTRTGTFTVVDKKPSKMLSSSVPEFTYDVRVFSFIDLGPNAPAIYAAPWQQGTFGKENASHGDIELSPDDATWLYNRLAVGDTIKIVGDHS